MDLDKVRVINAAGKLTALGGSAQSDETANAQAFAAKLHVDMNQLRQEVSNQIADLCGTEAACVTSGAAAGISVSVAALICKDRPELVTQLPRLLPSKAVVVQAGHNINFGASIEQMVHMTGADCQVVGTASEVTPANIEIAFKEKPIALLYVQSHHCIQENRVSLADCISLAHSHDVPVIVDAGVGTASDACRAMELGIDGLLMNTAIAGAQDPIKMACAMKAAVECGRQAFEAGRIPKKLYASASSPLDGLIDI